MKQETGKKPTSFKISCNGNNFFIIFLFFHQHHNEASTGARQLTARFKYITITSSVSANVKILEDKSLEKLLQNLEKLLRKNFLRKKRLQN